MFYITASEQIHRLSKALINGASFHRGDSRRYCRHKRDRKWEREGTQLPSAAVDDLQVAYDVHGSGEPVLMINGIGADRAGWGLQVPAVSREFTTITYDNRDVGETGPGQNTGFYSIRQFADDADRKSTRLNSSHIQKSRMPSSA